MPVPCAAEIKRGMQDWAANRRRRAARPSLTSSWLDANLDRPASPLPGGGRTVSEHHVHAASAGSDSPPAGPTGTNGPRGYRPSIAEDLKHRPSEETSSTQEPRTSPRRNARSSVRNLLRQIHRWAASEEVRDRRSDARLFQLSANAMLRRSLAKNARKLQREAAEQLA